ncbi:putative wall-associated receptor kinase-like 16 [Triticum dicoccoides]|uniref:putative wall-associated receptor kinase-like 16 n=1 Tax=Triticum dicoccoides TaxID=85692 RepID=UPI001891261C|nr:putative wall-associated receptor kinase-like 16 [Triticum dicoccoides]
MVTGCATFCSGGDAGSLPKIAINGIHNKNCYGVGCCQAPIPTSIDGMPNELMLSFEFADLVQNVSWAVRHRRRHPEPVVARSPSPSPRAAAGLVPVAACAVAGLLLIAACAISGPLPVAPRRVAGLPCVVAGLLLVPGLLPVVPPVSSPLPIDPCLPEADANAKPVEVATGICSSKHSHYISWNRGYYCQCDGGYIGNPYLVDGGCTKEAQKEFMTAKSALVLEIVACVVMGIAIIMVVVARWEGIKDIRANKLKRKFFEKNHGQLLQQLISQSASIAESMIMTLKELEKATHNFHKDLEVGGVGHGTVYKGILPNQHVVAVKKPNRMVQKEINEFINEVVILSQINHRNVVKLYGCCLETEVPILVYEFISNGTLYEHLHLEGPKSLSWDHRLRIAMEAAKSLAYLHTAASTPIIHRDVKSANILLDDTLTTKVADFGASKNIPVDISGVATRAQGTRGYWDPMYFYTGRLTEKSDVYSFGVVLVELLTRKKPFSYSWSSDKDEVGFVEHFVNLFEEDNLLQILDPQVIEEGGKEVKEVASVAVACIKLRREDRPTMRQVEMTLEGTRTSKDHALDNAFPSEEVESNTNRSIRRYSMEQEFILSAEYPR